GRFGVIDQQRRLKLPWEREKTAIGWVRERQRVAAKTRKQLQHESELDTRSTRNGQAGATEKQSGNQLASAKKLNIRAAASLALARSLNTEAILASSCSTEPYGRGSGGS